MFLLAVLMIFFCWLHFDWESAAVLSLAIFAVLVFDSIFGEGKIYPFIASVIICALGVTLLNSVFRDIVTTLKISFGFLLLKYSLNFFLEAFENPLRCWLSLKSKKKTAKNKSHEEHGIIDCDDFPKKDDH